MIINVFTKSKAFLISNSYLILNTGLTGISFLFINKFLINEFNYDGFSSVVYLESKSAVLVSAFYAVSTIYVARFYKSIVLIESATIISFLVSAIFIGAYVVTKNCLYIMCCGMYLNFDFVYYRVLNFKIIFYKNFIIKTALVSVLLFFNFNLLEYTKIYSFTVFIVGVLYFLYTYIQSGVTLSAASFYRLLKIRGILTISSLQNFVESFYLNSSTLILNNIGVDASQIGLFNLLDKTGRSSMMLLGPLAQRVAVKMRGGKNEILSMLFKMKFFLFFSILLQALLFIVIFYYYNIAINIDVPLILTVFIGPIAFIQVVFLQIFFFNKRKGLLMYQLFLIFLTLISYILFTVLNNLQVNLILGISLRDALLLLCLTYYIVGLRKMNVNNL